jgi:intracellular sulfur oxidation DsrE/DsrF family protein
MKRIAGIVSLFLATLLLAAGCASTGGTAAPAHRLVVQVSDGEASRWNMALNNIANVQAEVGEKNLDVVLVAYGPGIGMLKAEALTANRVSDAIRRGVRVVACENTLTNLKVSKADMHPQIGYVPAGASEIMRLQQQGYAYLRP